MTRSTELKTTIMHIKSYFHIIFVLILLSFIGCGRKGPPKPPEDFAPDPVVNLGVEGSVSGIKLSWEVPLVDPDAEEEDLKILAGFSIQKSLYVKGDTEEFDEITKILVTSPTETKYTYVDGKVEPGKIYNYQVLPFNEDQVNGEPGQTLRVTFLGENSRVERIILESERIPPVRFEKPESSAP